MANSGAFLPAAYGANHGRRLPRVREYRTVANGIQDGQTLARQSLALVKHASRVFYRNKNNTGPLVPDGIWHSEHKKLYDMEPVVVPRDPAMRGHMAPGFVPRELGNNSTLVPVSQCLNGEVGGSVGEIQRKYMPLGFAELTGRDTATPGLTAIMGGVITVSNPLRSTLYTGDYVMAVPPTQEEALSLVPSDGNGANGRGRVPYVIKKFDPQQLSFGNDANVRHTLATRVLDLNAAGDRLKLKDPKTAKVNSSDSAADQEFAGVLTDMIQGYANVIRVHEHLIRGASDLAEAIHSAALHLILSGQGKDADPKFLDEFLTPFRAAMNRTVDAVRRGLVAALIIHDDVAEIHRNNPTQAMVRRLATLKRDVEDSIMGIMVIGARSGCDGDIHLRAYAH